MRTFSPLPCALLALLAALMLLPLPAAPQVAAATTQGTPTDRLIIQLAPTSGAQLASSPEQFVATLSAQTSAELTYVRPLADGAHVLSLSQARPYAEVAVIARQLTASPAVLRATPDSILFASRVPSDPFYATLSWSLWPNTAKNYGINLPAAWDITTGSPSVVTAIIDTGGLLKHEDLVGRTIPGNPGYDLIDDAAVARDGNGRDPDPSDPGDYLTTAEEREGCVAHTSSWHGSHVAGTIGASANNGKGSAGVNWTSPLLFLRVLGNCGGYLSDITDGMRWAAGLPVSGLPLNPNPARVLNLSLGGGSESCDAYFQQAINAVNAAGAIVVVAAGNDGLDAAQSQPANCAGVISVAATNRAGERAWYSNYGRLVEIAAPGGDVTNDNESDAIYSTINSGAYGPKADSYGFYHGTSMATPHVSGIISLMLSVNPNLTPGQVLQLIQSTATPFPAGSSCMGVCGAGIINAGAAVEAAARLGRTVSFQSDRTVVSEGNSVIKLALTLSTPSDKLVTLPFSLSGSASPEDYSLAESTVSFAPGTTSTSLSIKLTDDSLVEGEETLVIKLGSGALTEPGAQATHTLVIEDNDFTPSIRLVPASLRLGDQRIGTTSAAQLVTISNPENIDLKLSALTLSGDFVRTGGSCPELYPANLPSGTTCTISLSFTPKRVGERVGTLLVSSNAPDSPQAVTLSGRGVIPALGFTPTSLNFKGQLVGEAGPTQTITLTNPGTAPMQLSAVTVSGDYRLLNTTCVLATGATLAPGANCTVSIGFKPQASGLRSGALSVSSDVPGGPYSAQLRGEGLVPALRLDAPGLNFAGQQVGTNAVSRTLMLSNVGSADLLLSTISVSGNAFERVGGTCPTSQITLTPGAGCTISIGFKPIQVENYSGSLRIWSNAPGAPHSATLTGVGTREPASSPLLSPNSLAFTSQSLTTIATTHTLTLSNVGAAAMQVSGLEISGTGFALEDSSCGALPVALAPGEACSLGVSFSTTGTEAISGTVTVRSDAPGDPQVVFVAGAGPSERSAMSLQSFTASGDAETLAVQFTISRAEASADTTSHDYSLIATRERPDADLPITAGSISFGPGETSATVSLNLARLGLYDASELVLSLDEAILSGTPTVRSVIAIPSEWHMVYLPMISR